MNEKMMMDEMFLFADRTDAGEQLAARLLTEPWLKTIPRDTLLVLSIPRGGVVVGAAIAEKLGCRHDIIATKKIGYPGHPELAIGAIAEDGTMVLGATAVSEFSGYIELLTEPLQIQLKHLIQIFRQGRPLDVTGKTVIVVDDGIATGDTIKAAVIWLHTRQKTKKPAKIVVAVPVCSRQSAAQFAKLPDVFVCLAVPSRFWAVAQYYWDFDQVGDAEVACLLQNSAPHAVDPVVTL